MSKWLPEIVVVLGALINAFTPQLQSLESHHTELFSVIASILVLVARAFPSSIGAGVPASK